jgi:hypothetical protein
MCHISQLIRPVTTPREDTPVKKTVISLSDGRELIYFDASSAADRSSPDQRTLQPAAHRSELRYNRARRMDRRGGPQAAAHVAAGPAGLPAVPVPTRDLDRDPELGLRGDRLREQVPRFGPPAGGTRHG